jgi:hypothetical protein
MEAIELQQQLFAKVRSQLSPHLSLADELATLLDLSADSVYRRIRGEKPITLAELKTICTHFKVSLDQLLQLQTNSVMFDAPGLDGQTGPFINYMKGMLAQFKYFNSFRERKLHYLCKDAPIWYFYLFPELGAFKTFFWSKTINNDPELRNKKFSVQEFPYNDCFETGQQVLEEHNLIESVELWNLESIHSTINQIAYYRDAGHFNSNADFEVVVESFLRWLDHLEMQAEAGYKFMPGKSDVAHRAPIRFYINELILGNNTMVINLDSKTLTMVTYSVFHYLFTSDERFTRKVMLSFEGLLTRSTLISGTGEKDRTRFFQFLRNKVNALCK